MANYTVQKFNCVQGKPQTGTNSKSANPVTDTTVTVTQVGTGYFYPGDVTAQGNISGTQGVIDKLVTAGAIA